MINKYLKYQNGQTLVLLLIFVVVAIAIASAATIIISTNTRSVTSRSLGMDTKLMAESGIEKALLEFVRNPAYTGETFNIDSGTITATVSGTTQITITSTAVNGDLSKRVEVIATYSNNVLTPVSWKEIN